VTIGEDMEIKQRTIKFRAWDTINERFIPDDDCDGFTISPDGLLQTWVKNCESFMTTDISHNAILVQFTGLYDKNGKEIYEGDLLKFMVYWKEGNGIELVKWDKESCGYWPFLNLTKSRSYFQTCFATAQVIGNIYENPELLDTN
jgi:uncharacterized phage protein (TIGR01671 family)